MRPTKMLVLLSALIVPVVAVTAQTTQKPVVSRNGAFGFSYVTYSFEPDDGVFTDNRVHATQNIGFRFNRSFRRAQTVGWMMDGELFLGVIDRELLDVPLPETLFGLHAFVGPQFSFGQVTLNAAGGVNRTSVPGTELVSSSRGSSIQYVGRGGMSRLWADRVRFRPGLDGFSALWRIPAGFRWAGTEEFPHDAFDHRLTDVKQHLDHTRADQVRLARMRSSTTSAAMLSRSRPTVATATSVSPAR